METILIHLPSALVAKKNEGSSFLLSLLGLFRFYQLLTLGYFILGCIYGPRLYDSLQKEGPMHLVIQLLSAATALQGIGSFSMVLYLRG